jgi:hypothetical protein
MENSLEKTVKRIESANKLLTAAVIVLVVVIIILLFG